MGFETTEVEVVVIGAGSAGVAATRHLVDAGVDVLLLEARDRLGGRAQTVIVDGFPIDLGCGWLHSADRNEWTRIAGELGFEIDRTLPPWQDETRSYGVSPAERREFRAASACFWENVETAARVLGDVSADRLLEPGNRWNALLEATSTYLNGAELARVSTLDFAHYVDTGINWRVPRGYGALIAGYGEGLPVRFDCPVTRIGHGTAMIEVETPRGRLRARAVIVSVPTDILASGAIRFDPELPEKREAAADLPLGNAEKLFLAIDGSGDLPLNGRFHGRTDRAATGGYHLCPFGRPMIEAFYGGTFARDLARGGMAEMAAFALEEIAGVMGHAFARRLRPLRASRWAEDPFAQGSYSCARPGRAGSRAKLALPVDGRIFFAGEACSPHFFSTAHGAYETGVAAAEALLQAR